MTKEQLIEDLRVRRAEIRKSFDLVASRAKEESRGLTDAESRKLDTLEEYARQIDGRLDELGVQVAMDAAAAPMARKYASPVARKNGSTPVPTQSFSAPVTDPGDYRPVLPGYAYRKRLSVASEPEIYREHDHEVSWFKDLYLARSAGDVSAAERLDRNNRMAADRARRAGEVGAEKRAISTGTGAGGEFVPPLWLEAEFVRYARPGRVTADRFVTAPLPPSTDVIYIPKILTGSAVAAQATQNTAIQNTDITTTSVSSPVVTIAGGQTVSLQLMEQSPLNIDNVILEDLAADYAMKLDTQLLTGSGSGGTLTGLLTVSGTGTQVWTNATPTLSGTNGLLGQIASATSTVHTNRYAPPDLIVMHPRRWAWIVAQIDSQNRPLVVPSVAGPVNAVGVFDQVMEEGYVGQVLGLPVWLDSNIPTNLGGGTNQDRIFVLRSSDLRLWESHIRAEAFQQTYAQNMSVFVRLYNYAAAISNRYTSAICIISGTGLVTPSF
ncbi:phage major capsid protein [Streptomyces sp. NPDC007971]|uniref:phage major capsid protein n=1 Tax=Streptomyces sp. NPDC007971 TaxID=3364799 RepID=UPI0036EE0874